MAKWFLTRVPRLYNGGKKQPLQKSLLGKKEQKLNINMLKNEAVLISYTIHKTLLKTD